jgi:hypothetical protein
MNNEKVLALAELYLNKKNIRYIKPGECGMHDGHRVEVIFMIPETLDPNAVVDPPDIRVWVNIYSGEVELINQM